MPSLAKILMPVDFSGRCRGAARYAEALGSRFGSEITLLHVLPPPHYEFSALEVGGSVLSELYAARSRQAQKDLDARLEDELGGVSVKRVLLEGDPAHKIVEYAHAEHASLILMPTHGYGPFRRFHPGIGGRQSPARRGLPGDDRNPPGERLRRSKAIAFRNVLVAVDLGPQSARTLEWAAWLAAGLRRSFDSDTCHAFAGGPVGRILRSGVAGAPGGQSQERNRRDRPASRRHPGHSDREWRRAGRGLLHGGGGLPADVLVIGRGSAAGMFGRLRTNAYAIIRQSPCPVVSV